jgi:hypothetical protein
MSVIICTLHQTLLYKRRILTNLWQNPSQHEEMHYVLKSTKFLILFEIRKNSHRVEDLLLYLFIKRLINLEHHCYQLHQKVHSFFFSQG